MAAGWLIRVYCVLISALDNETAEVEDAQDSYR